YIVRLPSRLAVTRPTSRSTNKCFETDGWFRSSASAISDTERSSPAMNSRVLRRRGSAIALKGSEVVAARGIPELYIPIWECVKYDFEALGHRIIASFRGGAMRRRVVFAAVFIAIVLSAAV